MKGRRRSRASELGDHYLRDIEHRRAAVARIVGATGAAADRLADAPPAYLLSHHTSDIARHCNLLSTLPAPGEVRVTSTPRLRPAAWHLDVAARDRRGLLACFTGVLAECAIDVVSAVIATWPDGGALQAFVVKDNGAPPLDELERAFALSLESAQVADPVDEAEVVFDNVVSPLFTSCEVRAPDRHGLLHSIAVAVASADADVHAASVSTLHGHAVDRFDVSDASGRKLDTQTTAAIAHRIRTGYRDEVATLGG